MVDPEDPLDPGEHVHLAPCGVTTENPRHTGQMRKRGVRGPNPLPRTLLKDDRPK